MLCSVCKENQATVHLTQIIGDKMQKVDLCESCSKEKGVTDPAGFSLAEMFLGGIGSPQETAANPEAAELKCSACGFTQADFKKTGRLGCPECYVTFSEGLDTLLKSMHKGTRHVGKVPSAVKSQRESKDKLKSLQKKLDKAIAEESYEVAAQLRDEIKHLKEKAGEVSSSS
jgi:protein arginine kinase activator